MSLLRKSSARALFLLSFTLIALILWCVEIYPTPILGMSNQAVVANIPTIESSHPYEPDTTTEWTVDNTTSQSGSRLYFSRIELEDGVDRIEVYDEDDVLVQIIDSSAPTGLWTTGIPGSLIKIKFIADRNVQKWGLEATRIEGIDYATVARSPHPYPNKLDDTKFLLNGTANPQGTRVHFDRIELESNVDYIIIMDAEGNPYQWITGSHSDFTSKAVPGAAIQVRLLTDSSVNGWGYNIDAVQAAAPDPPDSPPAFSDVLAETPHPIGGDYSNTWTIVNPDPDAVNSKIHFSQLSLSQYDSLAIRDANDKVVQYFKAGGTRYDLWSDSVPGRVVKITYHKSRWYDNWGFRIDAIRNAGTQPVLAESPHPYPSNIDQTWTIVNPDPLAQTTKINFERNVIAGYDSLVVMDEHDVVIERFGSGTNVTNFWTDYVTGRIVKIRLREGDHYEGWGFRVREVVSGPDKPALAESPHPYPSNIDQTWTIVNPDTTAQQTKVFFERMDIAGYDRLDILDSNDNILKSFHSGTHLRNEWTDYVPGRTIKVRLRESDHYEDWGFRVTDLHTMGDPASGTAYVGGLYLTLGEAGTVTVNGAPVIQASSPGEYKLTFNDVGEYLVRIEKVSGIEELKVYRKDDGNLQIITDNRRQQVAEANDTIASAATLILPHPGVIHIEGEEFVDAVSAGEYKIPLQDILFTPDGDYDVVVSYHDQSQSLSIIVGEPVHFIYLPKTIAQ